MNKPSPIAIGIDLGTTFSLVAYLDSSGRPKTVVNSEGDLLTPSVVLFEAAGVVVGQEAVKGSSFEPDRTAQFTKRDMGNPLYSKALNGQRLPPEVIQSFVLAKLKRDAEATIGPFTQAVITVPAYFSEPCRKATQDAGALAGIDVLDIINEPTAAAIAFGFEQGFLNEHGESSRSERIVVYDLGGGTFDVTVMDIDGKCYSVIATGGDVFLGGIDWDKRIVDRVAETFKKQLGGLDPRDDPAGFQRLLREAEAAKRALSAREMVTIAIEYGGHGIRTQVTRGEFEELTADLLERTRFTTSKVLEDAGCEWKDVTRVLLVGGSSRMPMVRKMVESLSGKAADVSLSFDEAVAHGAALYAGFLLSDKSGRKGASIANVNSHDLGVLGIEQATGRRRRSVLIPRNTAIPASEAKWFRTFKAGQRSVVVDIVEGGDDSGNGSTPIGKCTIRDLPPDLPASTPVEVAFSYEQNGRLFVNASVPSHRREASLTIERCSGQSDTALEEWRRRLADPMGAAGIFSAGVNDEKSSVMENLPIGLPEDVEPPKPPRQVSLPPTPPPRPSKESSVPPPLKASTSKNPPPFPPPTQGGQRKGPPPLPK